MCVSERKMVHYRRQAILKPVSITGQLTWPPEPQFKDLPAIHFQGRVPPNYIESKVSPRAG
jgi:hypothetical protein